MTKAVAKEKAAAKRTAEVVPVREVTPRLRHEDDFDHFFDRLFGEFPRWPSLLETGRWWPIRELRLKMPAVDVFEDNDDVVVKAELPGMSRDEIEVNVVNSTLTIKGEKKRKEEVKEDNFYRSERSYGMVSRSVVLPVEVKSEDAKATFNDGVLEVRLPKSATAKEKTRKVPIQ